MALRCTHRLLSGAKAAVADAGKAVLLEIDSKGFATITLNRPNAWNTFSDEVAHLLKLNSLKGHRVVFGDIRQSEIDKWASSSVFQGQWKVLLWGSGSQMDAEDIGLLSRAEQSGCPAPRFRPITFTIFCTPSCHIHKHANSPPLPSLSHLASR